MVITIYYFYVFYYFPRIWYLKKQIGREQKKVIHKLRNTISKQTSKDIQPSRQSNVWKLNQSAIFVLCLLNWKEYFKLVISSDDDRFSLTCIYW